MQNAGLGGKLTAANALYKSKSTTGNFSLDMLIKEEILKVFAEEWC